MKWRCIRLLMSLTHPRGGGRGNGAACPPFPQAGGRRGAGVGGQHRESSEGLTGRRQRLRCRGSHEDVSEVAVPEGGDLVSTGAWKFETRAELVGCS